jgi:HPt (histidine-containing phosphotransfer) domain-containing protein
VDTVPILDPVALERLRSLAGAVAKPGEDVLGHLVQIFVEDSDARLRVLEAAVAAGQLVDAARAVHNIKGAAANMGALRVVAAAVVVEASCKAAPVASARIPAEVAVLASELKAAAIALRRSFALHPSGQLKE